MNILKSPPEELYLPPPDEKIESDITIFSCMPRKMPACHQHNHLEINYMTSGSMTYLHGGTMEVIPEGTLVAFWAGRPHQVITLTRDIWFLGMHLPLSWVFQWNLPSRFVQGLLEGKIQRPPIPDDIGPIQLRWQQWIQDVITGSPFRKRIMLLEIEAWVSRIALAYEETALPTTQDIQRMHRDKSIEHVAKMARTISECFDKQITITEIAASAGITPRYAVTLFRKVTGSTLLDFLTRQRLSHAQLMLSTTSRAISDIAMESGFGSVSRFYAVFRNAFGISPQQYRSQMLRNRMTTPNQ